MYKIYNRYVIGYLTILLIFCVISSFYGCAPKRISSPRSQDLSPESLIKNITNTDYVREVLRTIANIEISSSTIRYPMKFALVLKQPQFLRAESLPVIGTPDFFFVVNGNTMKVFLPSKREFYVGRATAENIGKFFPCSLPIESLISILMGINPTNGRKDEILIGIKEENLYRVDVLSNSKRNKSLWIDTSKNHLVGILIFNDNEEALYRIHFEDFIEAGKKVLPQKIIIVSEKRDGSRIVIRYSDIQFSAGPDESLFDLEISPDIEPICLD